MEFVDESVMRGWERDGLWDGLWDGESKETEWKPQEDGARFYNELLARWEKGPEPVRKWQQFGVLLVSEVRFRRGATRPTRTARNLVALGGHTLPWAVRGAWGGPWVNS